MARNASSSSHDRTVRDVPPVSIAVAATAVLLVSTSLLAQGGTIGRFPNPVFPPGNPSTPAKVALGKALFFEEQLSSDNTMACATCHLPEAGGADPRAGARAPGPDGVLGTADDNFGSPGMIAQDARGMYVHDAVFGTSAQATERNAPTVFGAAFFNALFWDLSAGPEFRDEAGNVVLVANAALESQAIGPPTSAVEMAHSGIRWDGILAKLATVKPLRMARDIPLSLATFVGNSTDYGPLFARAFGDPAITRERIGMAIASYERTLIPDQTPFDTNTMTPEESSGLQLFASRGLCTACHPISNGLFSDGHLHTIGLPNHQNAVKTPTLRNVGLRKRLMHSGQFADLDRAITHYENVGFFFGVPLTAQERIDVLAFLGNALTDPRVVARQSPFDRPTLYSEAVTPGSTQYGTGSPGTGGMVPVLISASPPNVGHDGFKIGVGRGRGGALTALVLSASRSAPSTFVNGVPLHLEPVGSLTLVLPLSGIRAGEGVGTAIIPGALPAALLGSTFFAQGLVLDPNAVGLLASTPGASFTVFSAGVPTL